MIKFDSYFLSETEEGKDLAIALSEVIMENEIFSNRVDLMRKHLELEGLTRVLPILKKHGFIESFDFENFPFQKMDIQGFSVTLFYKDNKEKMLTVETHPELKPHFEFMENARVKYNQKHSAENEAIMEKRKKAWNNIYAHLVYMGKADSVAELDKAALDFEDGFINVKETFAELDYSDLSEGSQAALKALEEKVHRAEHMDNMPPQILAAMKQALKATIDHARKHKH